MALEVVYCLCGQTNSNSSFMIQCDFCKIWFHGRCVCVREYQAVDIDRFHCPRCESVHGPSVLKPRLNWHRHNYSEVDEAPLPVQTGTQVFIKELKTRHFPVCEDVVLRVSGHQLNLSYFLANGFSKPIINEDRNELGLIVPHNSFTVMDVQNYVGPEHEVDVIDVQRQTNVKMQLQEFVEYFLSPARTTVLNLISLEFSLTSLSQLVEPPYIVRKICWVTSSWPSDPPPAPLRRPNVNKYCLISVENSYTDFHIDFGGTSVWYHVIWGEKIFYLIKPTPANLTLYQRWMKASNQSEMFFGDQVDACYKCVVKAGETFFIPTGWIHAVLTPTDTLVFGGNFLNSYNIELQLQIYEMEKVMNTPSKYRFPNYESVCWFAAVQLVTELHDLCYSGNKVPPLFITGIRALMSSLRHWSGETGRHGLEPPPPGVQPSKLLKDLQKEVRAAEKQVVSLNPPKPERESKRRRKKVFSEDFIDYTELTSFDNALEEQVPARHKPDIPFHNENGTFERQHFRIIETTTVNGEKSDPLRLSVPKESIYPYGLGIGMTGTPPHDPNFPPYKNEYPTNVKTEFEWTEEGLGLNPYKLIDPNNIRIRMARSSLDDVPAPGTPPNSGTPPTPGSLRLKIGRASIDSKPESIYDFNDESDDIEDRDPSALMIDETPKNKRNDQLRQPLKIKLNIVPGGEVIYGEPIDMTGNVEVLGSHQVIPGHNICHPGIEDLLRASGYAPEFTGGSPARLEDLETGRASPSTREAIVGMLTMSRTVPGGRAVCRKIGTAPFKLHKPKRRYAEDEHINRVFQDDDYVYPTLDMSDDEDHPVFKPRGKKKEDEAWNPKARIRVSELRPERPTRMGVRRMAVEKGLEQAAARRQNLPMAKRAYQRRKQRMFEPQPGTSSGSRISPSTIKFSSKPKKGMATAKQRLGKILKIHKMLH